MVKVSILYPNAAGARLDFDYYTAIHMPHDTDLAPVIQVNEVLLR